RIRKRGHGTRGKQIRAHGFNAHGLQFLLHARVGKTGNADDALRQFGALTRPPRAFGQARTHLAGDAQDEQVTLHLRHGARIGLRWFCEDILQLLFVRDHQRLYPILRRKSRRLAASSAVSTPLGDAPSITPSTPRPCSFSATITLTGFAVAQKMEQTSGTSWIRPRTLMG